MRVHASDRWTKRGSCTAAFKLKLVEYAERHGNRYAGRAGREFDVCEKLIRERCGGCAR